jgi:hypothetical protein
MQAKPILMISAALATCLGVNVGAFALQAIPQGTGPFLVVSAPWGNRAAEIVEQSGGQVIGPTRAPLSVLAAGVSAKSLKQNGAWAVLDPKALGVFCTGDL